MSPHLLEPVCQQFPVPNEIELNEFDSVESSIRRAPSSIVFGKFFLTETF